MKLQTNHNGAWRNVALPAGGTTVDASLPSDEQLKRLSYRLCQGARGRRIVEDGKVIWTWTAEAGWQRPHWWRDVR